MKGKSNKTKNLFQKRHKYKKVGKGLGVERPTGGRDNRQGLEPTNKQKKRYCSGPEKLGDGISREGGTGQIGKEAGKAEAREKSRGTKAYKNDVHLLGRMRVMPPPPPLLNLRPLILNPIPFLFLSGIPVAMARTGREKRGGA